MGDWKEQLRSAGLQSSRGGPPGGRPLGGPPPGGRGGGGDRGGGRGPNDRDEPKRDLWGGFPESYFAPDADGRRCLRREFVTSERVGPAAESLAKTELTTGQLRRFFNHCRQLERRLTVEGESWTCVEGDFARIEAHAEYALAANKIPGGFRDFLRLNVRRTLKDENPREAFLRGFLPHFEALVGFGAAHFKKER